MCNFFDESDSYMKHVAKAIQDLNDDAISTRYVGFVAITAVTTYEIAIKKILIEFAHKTNSTLGNFASKHFEKLNARIDRDEIGQYLSYFGDSYKEDFKNAIDSAEAQKANEGSIKASFSNLLTWRHEFVHAGTLPNQATFKEAITAYEHYPAFRAIRALEWMARHIPYVNVL